MILKNSLPLTRHQQANGVSNAVVQDSTSGWLDVGAFDAFHVNVVASGTPDMLYAIQSMNYYDEVIDLHTGSLTSNTNVTIELDNNCYQVIRSNITNYSSGGVTISVRPLKRD